MRWVISSNVDSLDPELSPNMCHNETDERHVLLVAQDIIHCGKHGYIKTQKHVGLAMIIQHLSGSKQLITIINRLGDCSSYDVEAITTSLASENLRI